jgi:hypothetical protein
MSEQPDSHKTDRPRGFLTESDREFLLEADKTEMKDGTVYSKRHRIRERFKNAILDMQLLFEVNPADRDSVLPGHETDDELRAGAFAFNQILMEHLGLPAADLFRRAVRVRMIREYADEGYYYSPEIEIVEGRPDPGDAAHSLEWLAEKYRDGEDVPEEAVSLLESRGLI